MGPKPPKERPRPTKDDPKPTKENYPIIAWAADDKRLTHELFNTLKENDAIRRGIWPRKGETVSGISKAVHRRTLAKKFLEKEPKFKELSKDSKALTHYGNTIKNQLAKLEGSFKKAKETLGVTGAGLPNEDAIWDGENEIRDKWHEVKQICPWFFVMKEMVEDRFDDIGAAITNSGEDVVLDATQGGNRRRLDKEPDLEEVLNNGDNADEDEDMEDDVIDVDKEPSSPQNKEPPPLQNIGNRPTGAVPHRETSPPFPVAGASRRKPGVMSELTEGLIKFGTIKNERKRLYDVGVEETKRLHDTGVEETKRLEIRNKYGIEKKRLDLEERRLVMEERKFALEEERLAMKQRQENYKGRGSGTRGTETEETGVEGAGIGEIEIRRTRTEEIGMEEAGIGRIERGDTDGDKDRRDEDESMDVDEVE